MRSVKYPAMRREALRSVSKLADIEYQMRVWVSHEWPHKGYFDSLDTVIHWLFDDLILLPDPGPADRDVLLPGDERDRLRKLGAVLDPMIDRLGDVADSEYLADPEWSTVVLLARRCLPAFILAGGWESMESDADVYLQERAEGRVPTVELPATRRRVIKSVAALADEEYQRRTWTGDNDDPVTGSLQACVQTLTDDTHILPHPTDAIGRVLLAGDEIDRLATLWSALEPFRANPTPEPWTSPAWQGVVTAALHCLPALVIAGAWMGPDQDSASTAVNPTGDTSR